MCPPLPGDAARPAGASPGCGPGSAASSDYGQCSPLGVLSEPGTCPLLGDQQHSCTGARSAPPAPAWEGGPGAGFSPLFPLFAHWDPAVGPRWDSLEGTNDLGTGTGTEGNGWKRMG